VIVLAGRVTRAVEGGKVSTEMTSTPVQHRNCRMKSRPVEAGSSDVSVEVAAASQELADGVTVT
jgi:hypothetical protein